MTHTLITQMNYTCEMYNFISTLHPVFHSIICVLYQPRTKALLLQAAEEISSRKLAQKVDSTLQLHWVWELQCWLHRIGRSLQIAAIKKSNSTTGWPINLLPSRMFQSVCVCSSTCLLWTWNCNLDPLILEQSLHCKHNITKLCSTQRN